LEWRISARAGTAPPARDVSGAALAWHLAMHLGEATREILAVTCGSELREAPPHTPLPGIDDPAVLKALVANLELAFGIRIGPEDVDQLGCIRDVLQCVRVRQWEARHVGRGAPSARVEPERAPAPQAVFQPRSLDPRERFRRFTRPGVAERDDPVTRRSSRTGA
jgi:hypothetical protein